LTPPDIAYAVHQCARFAVNPRCTDYIVMFDLCPITWGIKATDCVSTEHYKSRVRSPNQRTVYDNTNY